MRIAVADVLSNSYFPVLAAKELGFFDREGLDIDIELMSPADQAYRAMQDGVVDFVGAEAHAALAVFPGWRGVKLLCAQSQGMYWFVVMRASLKAKRGDVGVVRGCRIGAAPWVELGLRQLLLESGIDPARDGVVIAPIPGSLALRVNTGVTAAAALEQGVIDGFWANGMGAEIAVRRGVGTVVLDVRRGDGPKGCFHYTFPALAATDRLIESRPDAVAGVVRAIAAVQVALRTDPSLAEQIGRRIFPPQEASLIAGLIARDAPFYYSQISQTAVEGLNRFARATRLLEEAPSYTDVVAVRFSPLWHCPPGAPGADASSKAAL